MLGATISKDGAILTISATPSDKKKLRVEKLDTGKYKIWHNLNRSVYVALLTPIGEPASSGVTEKSDNYCIAEFRKITDDLEPVDTNFDVIIHWPDFS